MRGRFRVIGRAGSPARGTLDRADPRERAGWARRGGFSLDAWSESKATTRLAWGGCYAIARAPFVLERREQLAADRLVYRVARPQLDPSTQLRLTALELIDRLAGSPPSFTWVIPSRGATTR